MNRAGWLTKLLGDRGERAAVRYLKRQGYRVLARQSRSRIGELDIVAMDGSTIVFVEVKTRSSHAAGHPVEAVTPTKQKQLTRAALQWLRSRRLLEHPGPVRRCGDHVASRRCPRDRAHPKRVPCNRVRSDVFVTVPQCRGFNLTPDLQK